MLKSLTTVAILFAANLTFAESVLSLPKSPKINLDNQVKEGIEKPKSSDQINNATNNLSSPVSQSISPVENHATNPKKKTEETTAPSST